MKKNVFSRTLAVLASTAVLGAASMMTASAAGESLTIGTVTGLPGETVQLPISVAASDQLEGFTVEVTYDTALAADPDAASSGNGASVAVADRGNGALGVVVYGSKALSDGDAVYIPFTIPEDAAAGTEYAVTFSSQDDFFVNGGQSVVDSASYGNGAIVVGEAETEAPEETEAETEAATEAATKAATKAAATGSPKTGTAGVAVAVAGLVTAGATAVVLKKRH